MFTTSTEGQQKKKQTLQASCCSCCLKQRPHCTIQPSHFKPTADVGNTWPVITDPLWLNSILLSITHSYLYISSNSQNFCHPVWRTTVTTGLLLSEARVGPLLTWPAGCWGIQRLAVSTIRSLLKQKSGLCADQRRKPQIFSPNNKGHS